MVNENYDRSWLKLVKVEKLEYFSERTDDMVEACTPGTKIVFGTSGWRGKLGQDFVLANVRRAAQGVADYYNQHVKQGVILIGFDPRRGNYEFAIAIASILAANTIPLKIILEESTPTPVLAYLANSNEEITGVINLTASHNKYADDGFKFSPHHGGAADKETTDLISTYANEVSVYREISYASAKVQGLIQEVSLTEALDSYVNGYIIPTLRQLKAWDAIVNYIKSNPGFKLVVDPMQGTSVKYVEAIYRLMEKEVGRHFLKIIHTNNRDPDFTQVNGAPNPTEPDSIKELVRLVSKDAHTLGLATDGDGDRFGVIDFGGKEISGNEIIAMLTYFLAQKRRTGTIGKTVVTSNFVNAVAGYFGLELIETPVGFKWFVESTVKEGRQFLVAGEESAHVGVGPFIKSWDDGIATGIMCLWMIAETQKSLTSYREEIETIIGKRFFYHRANIDLTPELKGKATALIHQAKQEHAQGRRLEEMAITHNVNALHVTQKVHAIITLDGLKVVFETGDWLCIRLSGTENVARLYTEVTDVKRRDFLRDTGKALLSISP
jgi:phosphomannomutase